MLKKLADGAAAETIDQVDGVVTRCFNTLSYNSYPHALLCTPTLPDPEHGSRRSSDRFD
ncbi:hypothetical protein [Paraburkholderia saeva]|uniref:hypothetical protein n=1 Tax=Paraburkholderia saeva TaxID=2777537 RepID=UPI001E64CCCC|nr:hypothetical protein [Paraburkholderia saeva]